MLLRRHRKTEEANLDLEVKEESIDEEVLDETDYSNLKVDELKNLLDEKEIEYDSKAKKEDLIKLLKGAE